jgi:amino acid permease
MDQNQQPSGTSLFQLNLDAQNSYSLRSAASWAKVLGIVGLIIGILCVIAGILAQQATSQYGGRYSRNDIGFSAGDLGNAALAVYLVMGLIFIISSIFALNAGNNINKALKTNDQSALSSGFAGVRNYFAFWAIMMIILLLLMILGVVGNMSK